MDFVQAAVMINPDTNTASHPSSPLPAPLLKVMGSIMDRSLLKNKGSIIDRSLLKDTALDGNSESELKTKTRSGRDECKNGRNIGGERKK